MLFHFQMVDRLDEGALPIELGPLDYKGLNKAIYCRPFDRIDKKMVIVLFGLILTIVVDFQAVGKALFRAHVEGQLKVNTE